MVHIERAGRGAEVEGEPVLASTALIVGGEDMVLVAIEACHHMELYGPDQSRTEAEHGSRQR